MKRSDCESVAEVLQRPRRLFSNTIWLRRDLLTTGGANTQPQSVSQIGKACWATTTSRNSAGLSVVRRLGNNRRVPMIKIGRRPKKSEVSPAINAPAGEQRRADLANGNNDPAVRSVWDGEDPRNMGATRFTPFGSGSLAYCVGRRRGRSNTPQRRKGRGSAGLYMRPNILAPALRDRRPRIIVRVGVANGVWGSQGRRGLTATFRRRVLGGDSLEGAGSRAERFLQRTNQTSRRLAGMEPEGEFGNRLRGTARTPNFGT